MKLCGVPVLVTRCRGWCWYIGEVCARRLLAVIIRVFIMIRPPHLTAMSTSSQLYATHARTHAHTHAHTHTHTRLFHGPFVQDYPGEPHINPDWFYLTQVVLEQRPLNWCSSSASLLTGTTNSCSGRYKFKLSSFTANKSALILVRWLSTWHCPHLLLNAVLMGTRHCRSISPARLAHSSKPATRCYSRWMGQTDRQTSCRYTDLLPNGMRAVSIMLMLLHSEPLLCRKWASHESVWVSVGFKTT